MQRPFNLFGFCFAVWFCATSVVLAQFPSMTDLEAQIGAHELTPAFQVEYEIAVLERAMQQGDSSGFSEGFDPEESLNPPVENSPMERLASLVIRALGRRGISAIDSLGMPGTFDFSIRDVAITDRKNKLDVSGYLEFTFLQIPDTTRLDTTRTPFNRPFNATYKKNQRRWKIKQYQGIADFFLDAIQLVSPSNAVLDKELKALAHLRTGYPQYIIEGKVEQ